VATRTAKAAADQGFRLLSVRQADTAARSDTADRIEAGDDKDDRLALARKAGARYALSGEVRNEGGRIHAAMHLEDVATRTTLWEDTYEGDAASAAAQIGIRAAEVTFCASTLGYTRFSARDVDGSLIAPAATSCAEFATGSNAGISGELRSVRDLASRYPDDALTQARLTYLAVETMTFAAPAAQAGLLEEAKAGAKKAVALDPDGYATAVARLYVGLGENQPPLQWAAYAEASLRRSPKAGEAFYYGLANRETGVVLGALGRHKAAQPYFDTATENDPFSPMSNLASAYTLAAAGQPGAAEKFDAIMAQRRTIYGWDYALGASLFLGAGDPDRLLAAPPVGTTPASVACWRDIQAGLKLTDPAARRAAAARADSCLVWDTQLVAKLQAVATLGDTDRVFAMIDRPDLTHAILALDISPLFFPSMGAVHADKRFLPLMQKLGYVDYWRQTKTQPDVCATPAEKDIPLCVALRAAN
jgi:tetratricopeptide (TPR) repeat protein